MKAKNIKLLIEFLEKGAMISAVGGGTAICVSITQPLIDCSNDVMKEPLYYFHFSIIVLPFIVILILCGYFLQKLNDIYTKIKEIDEGRTGD